MKPRIGIPVPTSTDLTYNSLNWQSYADAISASGGDPLLLPLGLPSSEIARLCATSHGFVLPGSPADVDPGSYGQVCQPETAPADPLREAVDRRLLEESFRQHKPLLGICFGAQILNVARGGTLVQDLFVLPVNHSAPRAVSVAHSAEVVPGSHLSRLVDPTETTDVNGLARVPVNSSHHQAVGIPGSGLRVSARCPQDGVAEAIEPDSATGTGFLLGVQWHPERTFSSSRTSRALFEALVENAALSMHSLSDG